MRHSYNFGHCFDFGVVFSLTFLPFPLFSILVLLFVQCSCCFGHCSDFGVVQCYGYFSHCSNVGVAFFVMPLLFLLLFQFWCCCLQYLIPDLVVVSILVLFWHTHGVLVIVCEMLLPLQSSLFVCMTCCCCQCYLLLVIIFHCNIFFIFDVIDFLFFF